MYSLCHISAVVCCSSLFVCCLHGAVSVQACPTVKIMNVTAKGWSWTWKTRQAILGKSSRLKTAQSSSLMRGCLLCFVDNCFPKGTWLDSAVTDLYNKLVVRCSYFSLKASLHSVQDVWQFSAHRVSHSDKYG